MRSSVIMDITMMYEIPFHLQAVGHMFSEGGVGGLARFDCIVQPFDDLFHFLKVGVIRIYWGSFSLDECVGESGKALIQCLSLFFLA